MEGLEVNGMCLEQSPGLEAKWSVNKCSDTELKPRMRRKIVTLQWQQ